MSWIDTTKELIRKYIADVHTTLREPGEPVRDQSGELGRRAAMTPEDMVARLRPLSLVLEITQDCGTLKETCQTCPRLADIQRAREARCTVGGKDISVGIDPEDVLRALDEVDAPITVLAGGEVTLRTDILALSIRYALERGSVVFLLTNCVGLEDKFERHRELFGSYPVVPHENLVIQLSAEGFDEDTLGRVRGSGAKTRLERGVALFKKLGFAEANLAANVTVNHTVARDLGKIVRYLEGLGVRWFHVLPIYPTPHMDSGLTLTEADRAILAEEALRLKRQGAGLLNSERFFQFVGGTLHPRCFPLGAAVFTPVLDHPPYERPYAVGNNSRQHALPCLVRGRFKLGCYYTDFEAAGPELDLTTYKKLREAILRCPNLSRYVERTHERCRECYAYCTFDIPGVSEWVLTGYGSSRRTGRASSTPADKKAKKDE